MIFNWSAPLKQETAVCQTGGRFCSKRRNNRCEKSNIGMAGFLKLAFVFGLQAVIFLKKMYDSNLNCMRKPYTRDDKQVLV